MKSILLHNHKGGVGKTTIAAHVAWFLAEKDFKVAILDVDFQGSMTRTFPAHDGSHGLTKTSVSSVPAYDFLTKRNAVEGGFDEVVNAGTITVFPANRMLSTMGEASVTSMRDALRANMLALDEQFDVLIIDSGPKLDGVSMACILCADYLLVPIEMQQYSVAGLASVMDLIDKVQGGENPDLRLLAVLPNRYNRIANDQRNFLAKLREDYGDTIYEGAIGDRQAFGSAPNYDPPIPVWKHPDRKGVQAAKDITPLLEDIANLMETD